MESTLLLRLPASEQETVAWQLSRHDVRQIDGRVVFESGSLALHELVTLQEKSKGCRIIVLVPGELVNLTTLTVPGRVNQAVIKSLPYRLEDDLGCDVDDVHVAVLDRTGDQLHLAVVDRVRMQQWSEWLAGAGIISLQWLPETLVLPRQEGQCVVAPQGIGNRVIVRHGEWKAGVCEDSWLSLYLDSLAEESGEVLETVALDLKRSQAEIFSEAIKQKANLLQGEWKPQAVRETGGLRKWRLPFALAAAVSCVWLGTTLWNTHQLQQRAEEYRVQSVAIYNKLFPGKRVVRLLPQLKRELAAMQQSRQPDQGLLDQLVMLAPVMRRHDDIKPVEFNYDHSRKQLKVVAESESIVTFSKLRDQVAEYGRVRLESVEQNGKVVTGVLVIAGQSK